MSGPRIQNLRHCLPPSIRLKLALRTIGRRSPCAPRPLGDLNAAMRDLDLGGEEILQLLEQRTLIGFNIAVARGRRSEHRILTHSLEHFRHHEGRRFPELAWPEIFRLVFPVAASPLAPRTLTGLELKQGLNCSRAHVENLASRYFEIVRPARPGRGNTPSFKVATVEKWLKSRML